MPNSPNAYDNRGYHRVVGIPAPAMGYFAPTGNQLLLIAPASISTQLDDRAVHHHKPSDHGRVFHRNQESAGRSSVEHSRPKLCVVCGKNPQYSNGRNHYSTCGLTCAAELESRNKSKNQMCSVCGDRPRHIPYRTCGLTCAAKLKSRGHSPTPPGRPRARSFDLPRLPPKQDASAVVPSVTYSACLMCWRAAQHSGSDFCSPSCESAAEKHAVLLLEVPQGHVTYKGVAKHFRSTWESSAPCPEVLKVYKIVERPASVTNYEKYRNKIDAKDNSFQSPDNESHRWYGTTRDCDLGDPDNESLCSSSTCHLCLTIQKSFNVSKPADGIHTSATSSRSDIHSKSSGKPPRKAMLLTSVVSGKEIELTGDELSDGRPSDCDSVQVINRSNTGRPIPRDDLIVYTKDAIRPLYIIFYK